MGFEINMKQMVSDMMPNIHSNTKVPDDIKDAWIELCVTENIDKLHDYVILW